MSPETWTYLGSQTASLIATVGTYLAHRAKVKSAERLARQAAGHAAQAVANTTATSNGFAAGVKRDLGRLLDEQAAQRIDLANIAIWQQRHDDRHEAERWYDARFRERR